jgi:hypothetical protein
LDDPDTIARHHQPGSDHLRRRKKPPHVAENLVQVVQVSCMRNRISELPK